MPASEGFSINVRISKRVLWVGSQAYPLHNIARVQGMPVRPDHRKSAASKTLQGCLGGILALFGIGLIISVTIANRVGGLVLLVLIVAAGYGVMTKLRRPQETYFALVIETSGNPHRVLVSRDRDAVFGLVHQITDAIDNPQAEFDTQINNVQFGDNFTQIGDHMVGKVVQ